MTADLDGDGQQDSQHPPIETSKLLVVEGKDDRNFFQALVTHLPVDDVSVRLYGGTGELKRYLRTLVTASGFDKLRSLGIVRDANGCAKSAFQSVQSGLRNADLPVPPEVAQRYEATERMTNGRKAPAVNVFVLPDCESPGSLETLLYQTLKPEIDRCITDFLECAGDVDGDKPKNEDKARVFAYLATREDPRHSVGVAAKQGVWDFDHPAFKSLIDFVQSL